MSRETWTQIKNDKNFNVHVYRNSLTVLVFSLLLNLVLGLLIFHYYVNIPERDYYATSGIVSPVKLTAMLTPNYSSKALLDPDPPTDDTPRVIPQ